MFVCDPWNVLGRWVLASLIFVYLYWIHPKSSWNTGLNNLLGAECNEASSNHGFL